MIIVVVFNSEWVFFSIGGDEYDGNVIGWWCRVELREVVGVEEFDVGNLFFDSWDWVI